MISIVLPSYNGERYIKQSIDSIIKQTYKEWELIIVNDCSTDNTGKIAEEYSQIDNRIRVVHNEVNKKLPISLNIGFEEAKGDFFTWTSDDNAFEKNALERLMIPFVSFSDVDFVFSNFTIIDQDDYVLFDIKAGPIEEIYYKNVIGASFLYKREIHFDTNGYNPKKFLVEDYDFWLKAKKKYKFFYLDEMLYYYRIHAESLSAERQEAVEEAVTMVIKENIQYIPEELEDIKRKAIEKARRKH